MKFSLIVAMDQKNGIGKDGDMPWHLPDDLKHFKNITTHTDNSNQRNILIMGRKTWDSIPEKFRPFKDRINLVLTRQKEMSFPESVLVSDDFDRAFDLIEQEIPENQRGEIFVIGGQTLFDRAICHPDCQTLYVTQIKAEFDCDTFFPQILEYFQLSQKLKSLENKGIQMVFLKYINVQS